MATDQSELYDHIKLDDKQSIVARVQELKAFLDMNM